MCKRCNNYGYFEVGISKSTEKAMMFCDCDVGRNLKLITNEWRLKDMRAMAENSLLRLNIIRAVLNETEKARTYIDELRKDLEEIIKRADQTDIKI